MLRKFRPGLRDLTTDAPRPQNPNISYACQKRVKVAKELPSFTVLMLLHLLVVCSCRGVCLVGTQLHSRCPRCKGIRKTADVAFMYIEEMLKQSYCKWERIKGCKGK